MELTDLQLEIQKVILKRIDLSEYTLYHDFISNWGNSIVAYKRYKLALNKPVTLQRVLISLWNNTSINVYWIIHVWKPVEIALRRRFLNNDGTDATLRDQTEETQKKVAELLWVTF